MRGSGNRPQPPESVRLDRMRLRCHAKGAVRFQTHLSRPQGRSNGAIETAFSINLSRAHIGLNCVTLKSGNRPRVASNLEKGTRTVGQSRTDVGQGRTIPLHVDAFAAIIELR